MAETSGDAAAMATPNPAHKRTRSAVVKIAITDISSDGESHAVEDVHLEQIGPRALSKRESPKLEAEQEGQREQIAGAPQCRSPAAHRIDALALAAVHQEGQRDAGEDQEDRRTDAAEELRKHERAVGSQVRFD